MKRICVLTLFMLVAIAASAQAATKVATTWTAAVYPTGTPNCSATVTANCANGSTETITGPSGFSTVTIPNCAGTVTTGCIAPGASSYTYTSPTSLPYGTYQVSLVTNTLGATGPLVSTPATATVVYALTITVSPAPTGVQAQIQ